MVKPKAPKPKPRKPRDLAGRRTIPTLDDARIAARVDALARIRELAPAVFDLEAPLPLKIGIHRDLVALGIPAAAVRDALQWWAGQPAYRRAVAAGGSRYGLDGAEAGVVTEDQQRIELAA